MGRHKRLELFPQVPQTRVLTYYTNAYISFIFGTQGWS